MSSSVNRSSDSPESSGENLPEVPSVQGQQPAMLTGDLETTTNSTATADLSEVNSVAQEVNSVAQEEQGRKQPIPPPSEPMQYRAIGLVRGKYMPSIDQLTRGTLLADDGTLIDAVLLGRVMSLVKNHLSLDESHLWVVYPRTKQNEDQLHVQIVGVWEPDKLHKTQASEPLVQEEAPAESEAEKSSDLSESEGSRVFQDGYFSIRGEAIFYSREKEELIIKIQQSPRKESDKTKFFRLKLKGTLGDKVVGRFWDLHAQLQANDLVIQEANDIGLMPLRKRRGRKPGNKRPPRFKKRPLSQRPNSQGGQAATAKSPPKRQGPVPKVIKRNEQQPDSSTSGNSS